MIVEYVIHTKNLKQALNHWLVLTKVQRGANSAKSKTLAKTFY